MPDQRQIRPSTQTFDGEVAAGAGFVDPVDADPVDADPVDVDVSVPPVVAGADDCCPVVPVAPAVPVVFVVPAVSVEVVVVLTVPL
ncbi:hypothetical protein [Streptomyces soliscabiei]|uniref:hypothetical protein n=1 Tax=Streptomyces soliscabiei TaxID=588897 RepID=UPI0029B5F62A|nr:hypothetical protein [Streptomyces sp. NY05-11A]MDX2677362.1 hypothetical protein [Streptomyces sp. NY05-11A]